MNGIDGIDGIVSNRGIGILPVKCRRRRDERDGRDERDCEQSWDRHLACQSPPVKLLEATPQDKNVVISVPKAAPNIIASVHPVDPVHPVSSCARKTCNSGHVFGGTLLSNSVGRGGNPIVHKIKTAAPTTIIKPAIHSTAVMDSRSNQVASTIVAKGVSVCARRHCRTQARHGRVEEVMPQRDAEHRRQQNDQPIARRYVGQAP